MLAAAAKKVSMAATNATATVAANKMHSAGTTITKIATAVAATAPAPVAGIHTQELFTLDRSIFNQVFDMIAVVHVFNFNLFHHHTFSAVSIDYDCFERKFCAWASKYSQSNAI